MRRALLAVDRDGMFCLPFAVKVVEIYDRPAEQCAYLLIEHPSLPEAAPGAFYQKYSTDELAEEICGG